MSACELALPLHDTPSERSGCCIMIKDDDMGGGSFYFRNYHQSLRRVTFTEMLDQHMQSQSKRRLSIVGPCYTHEQWVAVQAERRRNSAEAIDRAQETDTA
jgi:hypothetical protein